MKKTSITYADSGVDIDRADRAKQRIKYLAHRTFTPGVVSEIGGFGGMFALDKKKFREPVLVSSVDGVGTKLKVAFMMNLHHTVGGGSGKPLCERHCRAGRDASLFYGLPCYRLA